MDGAGGDRDFESRWPDARRRRRIEDMIATKRSRIHHPFSSPSPSPSPSPDKIRAKRRFFRTPTNNAVDSCLRFAVAPGLTEPASNFVFSPLLIRAALGLAAAGAQGGTLEQLLSFLGTSSISDLNRAAVGMWRDFVGVPAAAEGGGGGPILSFVNGIWVDKSMALKPSFRETAASVYRAVAEPADFQKEPRRVERDVNAWVEESTNGLIKNLIPDGTLDESTRVVLANALYFKGNWARGFERSQTDNGEFFLVDGNTTVQVPYMTDTRHQYLEYFDGFKALWLPYVEGQLRLSMLLYLPEERDGLGNLVRQATSGDARFFDKYCPSERVSVRRLKVPRFKISSTFEASEWLKVFGLVLPFSKGEANFSEMAVVSELEKLYFKQVVHRCSIEVDEEGSIASAATWMSCDMVLCASPRPIPTVEFVADHPFMFAIREDDTGALLFLGHVLDPSSGM